MRRSIVLHCSLAALFLLQCFFAAADEPGKLVVSVSGVQGEGGAVCVGIFDDADSFPKMGRAMKTACAKPAKGGAVLVFKGLSPGEYAAFAFHDEDGDKKIKKNWIGMPKEGVGASRGAKGFMGPPKFKDAKFTVGNEKTVTRIKLKYL